MTTRRSRSPSAARIAGDDYQHLVAWCWAMRAIQPGSDVERLAVEAPGAGSVDDVVLTRSAPPHEYLQVKYGVDARRPVGTAWLTDPGGAGGRSLLQRFHQSWVRLRRPGADPDMQLVTNRDLDPADSLLALRDGRTELLVPAAAALTPRARAGRLRAQWAQHLGIEEAELLEMLAHLRLRTGRSYRAERERAEALMLANGLRADDQAVTLGVSLVREWVASGLRDLTQEELRGEIQNLGLQETNPHAVLLIQAIDRDPHPEDATVAIDWVGLFPGVTAYERREPHDRDAWATIMAPELRAAAEQIRGTGASRVFVRGAMRLATWFATGAEFRQVTGMEVSCRQGTAVWESDARAGAARDLAVREEEIGEGDGLAVAVGITFDPTEDVRAYLKEIQADVAGLLSIAPRDGANDQAIGNVSQAVSTAQAVRQIIREHIAKRQAARVHLFLAAPGGFALLLGHRWNRVAPTVVYEDLGPGKGYIPTFSITA